MLIDSECVQRIDAPFPQRILVRPSEAITCSVQTDMWMFHERLTLPQIVSLLDSQEREFGRKLRPEAHAGNITAFLVAEDPWLADAHS